MIEFSCKKLFNLSNITGTGPCFNAPGFVKHLVLLFITPRVDANVVAAKEKLVVFIRSNDFVKRINNYDKRNASASHRTNAKAARLPHTTDMEDYASFI